MQESLSEQQKLILNIISNALFRTPFSVDKKIDWEKVFNEARAQAVVVLVYSVISLYLSEEEKIKWNDYLLKVISNNIRLDYEHVEVDALMKKADIPYVILKGSASAFYYQDPLLRVCGDVDFLVKRQDLARVDSVLEAEGFKSVENNEHEAHIVYHRINKQFPSIWEAHWSLYGIPGGEIGEVIENYFSDIIDTAIEVNSANGTYRIPNPFYHGLVLLLHTASHMINSGIGLRHLCDWAVFVEKFDNSEFCDIFYDKLVECGLWRFAQILTQLSVKYLGCTKKEWAAENSNDELLEMIMLDVLSGGNFGEKDSNRINQAKLITDRYKASVDESGTLKQLFRSISEKAKVAMPICKKFKVLLPIGWMYISVRHLFRIKSGTRPNINVRKMFAGANNRKIIYKQFRLFEKE